MGSLVCLVQLRSSSQWQLFNRKIPGLFHISDKYTCTMVSQKHWFTHCYSYQKRKQVYRMYKQNLSFPVDQYKETMLLFQHCTYLY